LSTIRKEEEKETGADCRATQWRAHVRPLIGIAIISLLLAGLFFPLLITGLGQALFPSQANGDLVQLNGKSVGSYYIDNGFTLPIFFHGRNETNPANASASGVDPDITLQDAYSQIPRISVATGIPNASLFAIVNDHEEGTFWIFGSPYVNVLNLNLVLIHQFPEAYVKYSASSSTS
jgi:potassium-transporting ATPase KdpC subunit